MAYYLEFILLWYISFTFSFAFGPFKSLPQNFILFWKGSKFWNFGLGIGKSWKSQNRIYLLPPVALFETIFKIFASSFVTTTLLYSTFLCDRPSLIFEGKAHRLPRLESEAPETKPIRVLNMGLWKVELILITLSIKFPYPLKIVCRFEKRKKRLAPRHPV